MSSLLTVYPECNDRTTMLLTIRSIAMVLPVRLRLALLVPKLYTSQLVLSAIEPTGEDMDAISRTSGPED